MGKKAARLLFRIKTQKGNKIQKWIYYTVVIFKKYLLMLCGNISTPRMLYMKEWNRVQLRGVLTFSHCELLSDATFYILGNFKQFQGISIQFFHTLRIVGPPPPSQEMVRLHQELKQTQAKTTTGIPGNMCCS